MVVRLILVIKILTNLIFQSCSSLLKDDMAVGVCLIPAVSIMYKWKGEVIEDSEAMMVIDTSIHNKINT